MLPQKLSCPEIICSATNCLCRWEAPLPKKKDYHGTKTKPQTLLSRQLLLATPSRQITEKVTHSNELSHKTHHAFNVLTLARGRGASEELWGNPAALHPRWQSGDPLSLSPCRRLGMLWGTTRFLLALAQQFLGRDSVVCARTGHNALASALLTQLWCKIPKRSMEDL